jgi:hypothetical protein
VRKVAIAGKNLPPVDAGEGVGVCLCWLFMCLVVCCLFVGCTSGVLVRVVTRPPGVGTGGRLPKDRQHDNLHGRYGIVLRCL